MKSLFRLAAALLAFFALHGGQHHFHLNIRKVSDEAPL